MRHGSFRETPMAFQTRGQTDSVTNSCHRDVPKFLRQRWVPSAGKISIGKFFASPVPSVSVFTRPSGRSMNGRRS